MAGARERRGGGRRERGPSGGGGDDGALTKKEKKTKQTRPKTKKTPQDRALESGWTAPKKATLEREMNEATGHRKHTRLATYLVHHAREFVQAEEGTE